MSSIIDRAQASSKVAEDVSLSLGQRATRSLEALSGLVLSDLNETVQAKFEAELVPVTWILSSHRNELESGENKLTDGESEEILRRVGIANRLCIDSETERVLGELRSPGWQLPVAAIEEVRKHPGIFAPLLLQSLEHVAARIREGEKSFDSISFFAMFLLIELKVDEAFPVLMDILKLPGDAAFDVFGDAISELTPILLAQFSDGKLDTIDQVVRDPTINFYVRWVATNAHAILVRDKVITRERAIEALLENFELCRGNRDYEMLAPLACALSGLAAQSALETIRSAFSEELIDRSVVDLGSIEKAIAGGEATFERTLGRLRHVGGLDTIQELSKWAAFQEPIPLRPSKPTVVAPKTQQRNAKPNDRLDQRLGTQSSAAIRSGKKAGRNDLCPCGSGKKYKKCCGSR